MDLNALKDAAIASFKDIINYLLGLLNKYFEIELY